MAGSGVAAAAFALGCLLQLVYLTWGKWNRRHVVGLLLFGPIGWFLATTQLEDPVMAAFSVTLALTMALALSFRETIIPTTGEHTLLLAALPIWALLAEADWSTTGTWALIIVHAASTISILVLVATPWHPPRGLRIAATLYAILQLVALFGWQFRLHSLSFFFGGIAPSPLEAMTAGLLFAFVVSHLTQIYAILRPPATETAERDTPEARTHHLNLLAKRFQTTHLGLPRATLLVLLFVAYWGVGRIVLEVESLVLLWPWLVLTPRLFTRIQGLPDPTTT